MQFRTHVTSNYFVVCEVRNVVMYQEFVILGLRPTNKRTHIQQKGGLNCKQGKLRLWGNKQTKTQDVAKKSIFSSINTPGNYVHYCYSGIFRYSVTTFPPKSTAYPSFQRLFNIIIWSALNLSGNKFIFKFVLTESWLLVILGQKLGRYILTRL